VLGIAIEIPPGLGYDATKSGAVIRQIVERWSILPGV